MKKIKELFKKNINFVLNLATFTYLIILLKVVVNNKLWNIARVLTDKNLTFKGSQIIILIFLFLIFNRGLKKQILKIWRNMVGAIAFAVLLIFKEKAILLVREFIERTVTTSLNNIWELSLLILCLIVFKVVQVLRKEEVAKNSEDGIEIFQERKEDLKRLKHLVEENGVVGIDDLRGSGKTVLVKELLKSKKNAEVIKLNILNVGESEIAEVLFKELNIVLSRNNGLLQNKNLAKKILKGQSVAGINLNPFVGLETVSERIKSFKEAIKSLAKDIYVVIDDLDRTSDVEKIKNALNIVGELSEGVKNLKFIILYSQKELKDIDESLDRNYFEKYIPKFFKLSDISFERLIDHFAEKKGLEVKDFDYLKAFYKRDPLLYKYKEYNGDLNLVFKNFKWSYGREIHLNQTSTVIRNVKNFVEEVREYFKLIKENEIPLEKRGVISYLYIKNFFYELYEKLEKIKFDKRFLDEFDVVITNEEESYSFIDILKLNYILTPINNIDIYKGTSLICGSRVNLIDLNEISMSLIGEEILIREGEKVKGIDNSNNKWGKVKEAQGKFGLSDENRDSLLAWFLFDTYFFPIANETKHRRFNKNIEHTIKKLNSWSTENLSDVNWRMKELRRIFKIENIVERNEEYKLFEKEMRENGKRIFYIGRNYWLSLLEEFTLEELRVYKKNILELMFFEIEEIENGILEVLVRKELYEDDKELFLFILERVTEKSFSDNSYEPLVKKMILGLLQGLVDNDYQDYRKSGLLYADFSLEIMEDLIKEVKGKMNKMYDFPLLNATLRYEIDLINEFLEKAEKILNKPLSSKKPNLVRVESKIVDISEERLEKYKGSDKEELYSEGKITPLEYLKLSDEEKEQEKAD